MRLAGPRISIRVTATVIGLVAALLLGLSAPRAPSAGEMRAMALVVAGGSLADICGRKGHLANGSRCCACCLSASPPGPLARIAMRVLRWQPAAVAWDARVPGDIIRRDRTVAARAPPRA